MLARIWETVKGERLSTPIRRMNYHEAMSRYGTDRPDLRFGLELKDVTELVADSAFKVFTSVARRGGVVKGLRAPGGDKLTKNYIEGPLTDSVVELGARGLAWFRVTRDGGRLRCTSSILSFSAKSSWPIC